MIPRASKARSTSKTRGIFIESLANPGGEFVDIEKIGDVARKHGLPLIVDNTLASPYLVRPIEHGADIVVHSLTKFIGGHGNSMGGAIVDGGTFDWSKSRQLSDAVGAAPRIWRRRAARDLWQFRLRHRLPGARPARSRPGDLAVQRLPDPDRRWRRCRCACSAIATMRRPSPNGCRSIPRSPGCPIPACRATRTTPCRTNTRRSAPARSSPSG